MPRSLLMLSMTIPWLGLSGCAAGSRPGQPQATMVDDLPGITAYYEQATARHHRAVRKPVRDAQARALRKLAQKTDELIAETQSWDSDARLVSVEEAQRSEVHEVVAEFRESLQELHTAAASSDLQGVRREYARALASYHHVHDKIGAID